MISTPVGVPSVLAVVEVSDGGVSDGLLLVSVDVIVLVTVSELAGRVWVVNVVAVEVGVLVGDTTDDSVEDVVDAGSVEADGVDDSVLEEGVAGKVEELGISLVWVTVGVIVIVMTVSLFEVLGAGVALAELDGVAAVELEGVVDGF